MKCIAIDDENMALKVLETYIAKVPFLELAGTFTDAIKALEFLHGTSVDILFVDINMPDISGIQLVRSLPLRPNIIVTSAYPEYAAESYEFDAVDYLLKPIEFERFLKAVNKARLKQQPTQSTLPLPPIAIENNETSIIVKSGTALRRIKTDDILYIEATGNYVSIVLERETVMSLQTMSQMMELLPTQKFIRVHKSYIVPLRRISTVNRSSVLIGSREIPIGSTYREALLQRLRTG